MSWKLVGTKTLLAPFASAKKNRVQKRPEGSVPRATISVKLGYEVPGFKGAPWCPVDVVWHPRQVWILEMLPKDSQYSYGRQRLYVDQNVYVAYFKEVYDRADEYWKTVLCAYRYQELPDGKNWIGSDFDLMAGIDDKTHHATIFTSLKGEMDLPLERLGPGFFTPNNMLQLSK
jgi:hypothetical protein